MNMIFKSTCLLLAILSLAAGAGAQTYTVLKSFNSNGNPTGYQPKGTLAQGTDGTLYGVAAMGGAGAAGVVFRIQADGSGFTVIKNFPLTDPATGTNSDGANPQAGLILSGGTLYGTTAGGGIAGQGTVFSLGTNGSGFTVLKSFTAVDQNRFTNTDGASPAAALLLSGNILYGTTQNGGTGASGTIFQMNTDGSDFTNIYSFSGGNDGANPKAPLILSGGMLYGTAALGGDLDLGTVFGVNTDGTGFIRLHSFSGAGTDGDTPLSGLVLANGMLFGTTLFGDGGDDADDGTVFQVGVTGGNTFSTVYSFAGSDGHGPMGDLILSNGTFYGTTSGGDLNHFFGTVFEINTDGTGFATICTFDGDDGWGSQGGLVLSGTTLYGTTVNGGLLPTVFALASGTVFSVDLSGDYLTDLCVFPGASGAGEPDTGLALSGNTLFGTAGQDGIDNSGAVFEINTNGSDYSEIWDFSGTDNNGDNPDGAQPRGVLVLSGGMFYGTTRYGGTNGWGTVFKMDADGTGFTNIYSFSDAYPESPITALVVSGNTLYGAGGAGNFGSIFALNTDGSGFTNIYNFSGTDGNGPGGLTLSGNTLYGTTEVGGTGSGNVFQMNTDGSHYTNIYTFTGGGDGANPGTVLILSGNTLYGTAYHGGSTGQGTVFAVNTDQTGFTVLHNFTGTSPNGAGAGDLLLSGGTLYGSTAYDGTSNAGSIFELDIASTNFTVLKNFTGGNDGANPTETLVLAGGTLYGTTQGGGLADQGTVFSLSLSSVVAPIPLSIHGIGNAVVLSWTDPASIFSLQSAPSVTGVYTNVIGATSPYTNAVSGTAQFFRLQAN